MTSLLATFNDAEARALCNSVPHRISPKECRELTPLIEEAKGSTDAEEILSRVAEWAAKGYVANYTSVRRIAKAVEKLTDGEKTFTPLGVRELEGKLPDTTRETSADIEALINNRELAGLRNQGFKPTAGKLVRLGHGCVVEGSVDKDGLQPHYVIDCNHPKLAPLLLEAREIGKSRLPFWEKIGKIVERVRETFPRQAYEARPYRRLMRIARDQKRNISLGEYIDYGAGVCREHAMLTHLMLNEAGFNSFHAYMNASHRGSAEEHAISLVRHKGQLWIVDPFHASFHGGKLRDFTSHRGNQHFDDYAPVPVKRRHYGCRLRMNDFPTYWIPHARSSQTGQMRRNQPPE